MMKLFSREMSSLTMYREEDEFSDALRTWKDDWVARVDRLWGFVDSPTDA